MIKRIMTTLTVSLLTSLSIYLIWGWLTINDICTWSAKQGLDSEKVLSYLAQDPDFELVSDPNGRMSARIKPTSGGPHYAISRLALGFAMVTLEEGKGSVRIGSLLQPFLFLSENVNRLFCCFGIGYMTGLLVVGIEFLRKKECTQSRLIIRPLAGALAACLLFIIVISGGAIIWNEVAGMNGLSLGMIGVIGSLFCDRLKVLTTSL